jgi:Holliday junction DNA helicase RuvA
MIGSLRGKVLEVHVSYFLLEVCGVGYVVKAAGSLLSSLTAGEEKFFYIHDHIREDAHDVFGFFSTGELEMFERLLSVNGVGPKVALTMLSIGSLDTVRRAITNGDLSTLTSVPGVGKKTAQKIILDLKGKLVEEEGLVAGDGEVVEALVSLGYSAQVAREILKTVPANIVDVSARVREALKYLAK